jgi:isopentenyl diphosphate isomerase/L-lactate dehydrogenase-like FMN-dependent dehydrogenase
MFHADGETATARAAAETGAGLCLSTVSSTPLEAVAEAHDGAASEEETGPRWFQVYWSGRAVTASMVSRAERAGYTALVLTVDAPVTGWRVRELASGDAPLRQGHGSGNYVSDPVFRERTGIDDATDDGRVADAVEERLGDPSLDWEDVAWLRERTDLPVYVKGVCHPADAGRAAAVADGVVVSNHGGRQVDGELAALDALGPVVETVDGRVPVLFDSGVRTGADVFRALALGADAVLVGRPYVYGLALAGSDGVADVVRNLRAAFDLTLELTGYATAAGIDRDAVVRVD